MASATSNAMTALIILMATGVQEEDLTHKPQMSLFTSSHVRHTTFSQVVTSMNNTSGNNSLTSGEQTFTLARAGDLVNHLYLRFHLPGIANFVGVNPEASNSEQDSDGNVVWSASNGKLTAGSDAYQFAHLDINSSWCPVDRCTKQDPADAVNYIVNPQAGVNSLDFTKLKGKKFQLVEKSSERKRMTIEAANGSNPDVALHIAGPEPYYAYNIGYALAYKITHSIGTQQIDRSYGQFMAMWQECSDARSYSSHNSMYGDELESEYGGHVSAEAVSSFRCSRKNRKRLSKTSRVVYVPTTFGFARTAATAMPLVACHFNNVNVSLQSAKLTDCIMNYGPTLESRSGVSKSWLSNNNGMADTGAGALAVIDDKLFSSSVSTLVIDPVAQKSPSFTSTSNARYSFPFQTMNANPAANWKAVKQNDAEVNLMANMIHLGTTERAQFSDASMEQLIVQTQTAEQAITGVTERTSTVTFHHPTWQIGAIVSAAPDSSHPNREPLDGRGVSDAVNLLRRPAIERFQVYFNNAEHLPSVDGKSCDYNEANMINPLFRGTKSANENGGLMVLFCTDAMRAYTQNCGHVNLSRVDDLSFRLEVDPVLINGMRDVPAREAKKVVCAADGCDPETVVAQSVSNASTLKVNYYASSYNLLRFRNGLCGAKWAL